MSARTFPLFPRHGFARYPLIALLALALAVALAAAAATALTAPAGTGTAAAGAPLPESADRLDDMGWQ